MPRTPPVCRDLKWVVQDGLFNGVPFVFSKGNLYATAASWLALAVVMVLRLAALRHLSLPALGQHEST